MATKKVKVRIIKKIPHSSAPIGRVRVVNDDLARKWELEGYVELVVPSRREVIAPAKTVTEKMNPVRNICGCGYVGVDEDSLTAHQSTCEAITKLNLGCGGDIRKGYKNVDVRKIRGVDFVADISDTRALKRFEGCATEVLALDVIEHFPQAQGKDVLKLWISLLAPGGVLEIRCPDLLHAASLVGTPGHSVEWFYQLTYGGQDYPENYHMAGYTLKTMSAMLKDLGLTIISSENTNPGNLVIKARR